ncbi:MAG: type I methionyl aminopeptidase [Planctomycetota bacterium]
MIRRHPRIRLVEQEREMMRVAGQFNAALLDFVRPQIQPGVKTEYLDQIIHEYTLDHGHIPACLGYPGEQFPFPKSCCISVNEVICHGIPGAYELQDGDIVNVDLTTIVDGWHGDQSETFLIGSVSDEARAVTQCAFDCLYLGIDALSPGCRVSVIGEAIVNYVRKNFDFGIVDKYVGHGIGTQFHQRPNIPHVPSPQSRRERLHPGMCFTIEPMINGGTSRSVCDRSDGWTVRTLDGRLSAQFEHTILMTEDGPEILTLTQNGPQRSHKF